MSEYEFIDERPEFDIARVSHEYRYKVAGKYTTDNDIVVDMACGTAYGKKFLKYKRYIGVDKYNNGADIVTDLVNWEPDFDYDVAISLETIEHLSDYTQHIENLKRAKRIVISVPIIPTKHRNKFHLQDFTKESIKELFSDCKLIHEEIQNDIYIILVYETSRNDTSL